MLCFEREARSKALRKLNLIIKQLYKIRELDLLSESEAINEKNLAKARFSHIFIAKKTVL